MSTPNPGTAHCGGTPDAVALPEHCEPCTVLREQFDDLERRANQAIAMLAGEAFAYRVRGHMSFHATKRNPKGSITEETKLQIEETLTQQLDELGFELRRCTEGEDTQK